MCDSDKMCWETCSNCGKPPKVKDPKPELKDMPELRAYTARILKLYPEILNPHPLPRKEVISIQPGDVVVLRVPDEITADRVNVIEANAKDVFPQCKIVVLASGMTLEVYREQVQDE